MYHAFLMEFLPLVKNEGVHVNMETCGMFKWAHMKSILPFLDLIFYDLKLMDSKVHQIYTGVDNTMVIKNLSNLAAKFSNLQARMPVIPTINDTQDNIADTVRLLKKNNLKIIHLLPYHNLGEANLLEISKKEIWQLIKNYTILALPFLGMRAHRSKIETFCLSQNFIYFDIYLTIADTYNR